jgi:hypothetical protein
VNDAHDAHEAEPALIEQAQELLDLAAQAQGGRVRPVVTSEFLAKLRAIVDEHRPQQHTWEIVGLGGARWIATFQSAESAGAAALFLMTHGHGHHFAVTGEGQKIIMSKMATMCLAQEFGPTGQPPVEPRVALNLVDLDDDDSDG